MDIETVLLGEGAETRTEQLYLPAYIEFPEFGTRNYNNFHAATKESIEDNPRVELLYYDSTESTRLLVGFAVVVLEDDMHVGLCASMQWAYVLPDYRTRDFYRQALKVLHAAAHGAKAPVVSYSKRVREGEYLTKYRRAGWVRK